MKASTGTKNFYESKALDQDSKDWVVILTLQLLALSKLDFGASIFIIIMTGIIIPTPQRRHHL